MISLSSSDIVIAAGGLKSTTTTTTTTTNSSSSLQPTHSQMTSHLRQVRSLEKEYNPSINEEEQFILPVPNINKIYGRSLDEILDKTTKQQNDNEKSNKSIINKVNSPTAIDNSPIKTTSVLTTTSPSSKPPLIKMKNVILNSVNVIPNISQVKSAPNSGDSTPKNLSFDSDVGDLAISDPGSYTISYQQQSAFDDKDELELDSKTSISKRYYLSADNPSMKLSSSLEEIDLNENEMKSNEYKQLPKNLPSFLIEEETSSSKSIDEVDKQISRDVTDNKNDLNNNKMI
jgi:hypothetical protein